jgi:hypothetical protein
MINRIHKCKFCTYFTTVKCNLIRHENAKHNYEKLEKQNDIPCGQNDIPNGQNDIPDGQNDIPDGQDDKLYNLICKKCSKIYKSKKNLIKHESKCNKVDNLTCPRCMKSFTHRNNKNRHIKADKCEARSIIHSRNPNVQNVVNNNNNNNTTNNNIGVQNNYIINNYHQERLDYFTFEKMLEIWKKGYSAAFSLTNEMHFNKAFPENKNILKNDKTSALVKENGSFVTKDIKMLAEELFNHKSSIIQDFAYKNKAKICESVDMEVYEEIADLLMKLFIKQPMNQYKKQVTKIVDMIKNN